MRFEAAEIPGVFHITATAHVDERGFFARIYCPEEFTNAGIDFTPAQISISRNTAVHTLRGMHWQDEPFAEAKVVRCVRGAVYDVVADLRPLSPTFRRWTAYELSAENANALFIPKGCAHGFLTLEADSDVVYQIDRMYQPGRGRGLRYDDAAFHISWPNVPGAISDADLNWPAFAT